jgi:hypothetical protein
MRKANCTARQLLSRARATFDRAYQPLMYVPYGGNCEGERSQSGGVEQLRELTCQIRPFARTSAMAEVRPGHQSMATGRWPSGTPRLPGNLPNVSKGRHLPMACGCERSPADVPHQTVGPRSCQPSQCERCHLRRASIIPSLSLMLDGAGGDTCLSCQRLFRVPLSSPSRVV